MPGLVNAHHHLYSIFARGFTPPGAPAGNFEKLEIAIREINAVTIGFFQVLSAVTPVLGPSRLPQNDVGQNSSRRVLEDDLPAPGR